MPFVKPYVAVMPDAHYGMGATVGSVVPTVGAVMPAAVGVDIGCLDSETEFLSPMGWKKISEWAKESVLVYDPDRQSAHFEVPNKHVVRKSRGMYHLKTKYGVNQVVSPDHRMLVYFSGRKRSYEKHGVVSAEELKSSHENLVQGVGYRINTTPEHILLQSPELPFTDAELRVIVMTAADTHVERSSAVLHVKKTRKFERALRILKEANREIVSISDKPDIKSIRFRQVTETKSLSQLWGASVRQLRIIAEEALYWDGNIKNRVYYTRLKEEADFVQWAALASGYRAVLRTDMREDGTDYRVFYNTNTKIGLKSVPKTPIQDFMPKDGKEYCFSVSTGFFLIRRNGVTALTGNCGMIAVRTNLTLDKEPGFATSARVDHQRRVMSMQYMFEQISKAVPHGRSHNGGVGDIGSWNEIPQDIADIWESEFLDQIEGSDVFATYPNAYSQNAPRQLGTLGTGNHFIEVAVEIDNPDSNLWVIIHSGSRGFGNKIGSFFTRLAGELNAKYFVQLPNKDLGYLVEGSEEYDLYLEALELAQKYAWRSREIMMDRVLEALGAEVAKNKEGVETTENGSGWVVKDVPSTIHMHHNYLSAERHFGKQVLLTRKGAVDASLGKYVIIPGSMGAKTYIARGLGNLDSFHSCSHGAGRAMSRGEALRTFSVADHVAATAGVFCDKTEGTIDETPGAYKNVDDVMRSQSDLVEPILALKQIVSVKGISD
jgi:RNA-splicing ligase RtcB